MGHYGNLYLSGTSFNENWNNSFIVKKEVTNTSTRIQGIPDVSMIDTDPEGLALEHVRKEVLDYYNFVAVTERWTESMAVLKMLLPGVQYSDLIVLRTKERGTFVSHGRSCRYVPNHSELTDSIQAYLDVPYRSTNPDYLLYAAVNRSLDLTIESIGRDRVDHGVRDLLSTICTRRL